MIKLHWVKLIKKSSLLKNVLEFNSRARPKAKADKKKNRDTYESINALYGGIELVLNDFKGGIFPLKSTQGKGILYNT